MADEPAELMDTYEALRIVEMFVKVAEESDNPDAASPPQREIRAVLTTGLPRRTRRRRIG